MTAGQRYSVSVSSVCSLFLKLFTTMSDPREQMVVSSALCFLFSWKHREAICSCMFKCSYVSVFCVGCTLGCLLYSFFYLYFSTNKQTKFVLSVGERRCRTVTQVTCQRQHSDSIPWLSQWRNDIQNMFVMAWHEKRIEIAESKKKMSRWTWSVVILKTNKIKMHREMELGLEEYRQCSNDFTPH